MIKTIEKIEEIRFLLLEIVKIIIEIFEPNEILEYVNDLVNI